MKDEQLVVLSVDVMDDWLVVLSVVEMEVK